MSSEPRDLSKMSDSEVERQLHALDSEHSKRLTQ